MASDADVEVRPLTREIWNDVVAVFGGGEGRGDCGRCWCMWWRLPRSGPGLGDRADLKAAFLARVEAGPPPGLVGYREGIPVGWVQVGPRADVPMRNRPRTLTAPLDADDPDDPVHWGVSCFVVRVGHRGRGVAADLLDAAIVHARDRNARILDACPVETVGRAGSASLFHGPARLFAPRGFVEIARRKPNRPLLRLAL